jgi:hypothetical protein
MTDVESKVPSEPLPETSESNGSCSVSGSVHVPSSDQCGSGSNNSQIAKKVAPSPPCSCPSTVNSALETVRYSQCPICLAKFDLIKIPVGLRCGHTLCLSCVRLLIPGSCDRNNPNSHGAIGVDSLNTSIGLANIPLLAYLEYPVDHFFSGGLRIPTGEN